MQRKRDASKKRRKTPDTDCQEEADGLKAEAAGYDLDWFIDNYRDVLCSAFGFANPRISTNIRIGGGKISDRPTPVQYIGELENVMDLAKLGSPTPALVQRVAGLMRWTQQDREWRHSGYDEVTIEQVEIALRELKDGLDSSMIGRVADVQAALARLRTLREVLNREMVGPLELPPLTPQEQATLRVLADREPHSSITSEQIAQELHRRGLPYTDAPGIRSRHIPKFKSLGLKPHGRRGYSFPPDVIGRLRRALDPGADEMRLPGGS